jgi:hypothetical protein
MTAATRRLARAVMIERAGARWGRPCGLNEDLRAVDAGAWGPVAVRVWPAGMATDPKFRDTIP